MRSSLRGKLSIKSSLWQPATRQAAKFTLHRRGPCQIMFAIWTLCNEKHFYFFHLSKRKILPQQKFSADCCKNNLRRRGSNKEQTMQSRCEPYRSIALKKLRRQVFTVPRRHNNKINDNDNITVLTSLNV